MGWRSEEIELRQRSVHVCAAVLMAALLLAASTRLQWASVDVAGHPASARLTDAPIACAVVAIAAATIAVGALLALLGWPDGLRLAALAGMATAIAILALILVSQWLLLLLPDATLLLLTRRLTLSLGTGPGAWIGLVAALLAGVLATEGPRQRVLTMCAVARRRGLLALGVLTLLPVAAVALVQLRQAAWLEGTLAGRTASLSGAALPWVAFVSFAADWLVALGAALAWGGVWELGAMTIAFAGWLANLAAAITVATARALAGPPLGTAAATAAVWIEFGIGLCVVAGALLLMHDAEPRGLPDGAWSGL